MVSNAGKQMQTAFWTFGISGFSWTGGKNSTVVEDNSHLMSPGPKQLGFLTFQQITPDQFSKNCSHKFLSFVPFPEPSLALLCLIHLATTC